MLNFELFRWTLRYCGWPSVFFFRAGWCGFAFDSDHPMALFTVVYAIAVAMLFIMERLIPYEGRWLEADGETRNDIAHTLLTKGLVQVAALAAALFPMIAAGFVQPLATLQFSFWPSTLPFLLQVALAVIIAEFGLYWSHRVAHERLFFWRFHALHHSVTRLWVVNTGRFHVIDSFSR